MSERFSERMQDPQVSHDTAVMGDLIAIWCEDHHRDRGRECVSTPAALLGVYGRKVPVLCAECERHLAYAEQRRALCPKEPKPFCAHCDILCYQADEAAWQRRMMRYSGPRSWRKGRAIDGIRHVLERRRWKREARRLAQDDPKGTR